MRLLPLLTALLVMATLYLLVMQRPALIAFAGGEAAPAAPAAEAAAEPAAAVAVVAQRSTAREVPTGIVLRGRTEAAREVEVRAETSGLVISEPRRKGAFVTAGDTLCALDSGTREADLAEAQARLAEAEVNERVAVDLRDKGFAPETRVLSARAALQSAEAAVERARREIDRLALHAPFDGLLETDAAEIGTLLQPGALCATVIQLDPIRLVGFVPETDVNRVAPGAEAGARLANGETVRGRVVFVGRSADPTTRTFRVEIEVANPDLAIRDGQTAEILIAAAGARGHLLPASALTLDDAGRLGVRSAAEGVVAFHPVSILRDTPEGVWLTGLPETLDVIVLGQEYVVEGSQVRVTLRDSAQ